MLPTKKDIFNDNIQHWGHFHRPGIDMGVYTFGDECISEVEWDQIYLLYAKFENDTTWTMILKGDLSSDGECQEYSDAPCVTTLGEFSTGVEVGTPDSVYFRIEL